MSDIYTMTPGSAVSDVVQQILQRRRDEQRQMMLDRLGIEKYRADEEQRGLENQLAQQQEARQGRHTDAQIAESKARILEDRIKGFGGYGETEVSPELQTTDPELWNEMLKRNRIQQRPGLTPQTGASTDFQLPEGATPEQIEQFAQAMEGAGSPGVETSPAGPATAPRWVHAGSDKFQEAQDARNRIQALSDANLSAEQDPLKLLLTLAAAGIDAPQGVLPNRTNVLSPGGKTVQTITGRMGDETIELNHPPQPSAVNAPYLYQIPGPNGTTVSHWLRPGEQPTAQNKVDASGPIRRGNEPNQSADMVPQQAWRELRTAVSLRNVNPAQKQAAITQAMSNVKAIAAQRGVSPQVLADLSEILRNIHALREAGMPVPQVNELVNRVPNITPIEQQQLTSLLYGFFSTEATQ